MKKCIDKVVTLTEAARMAKIYQRAGKKIVLATGVYDIFHPGHLCFLETAASKGDILIVGVAGDELVKATKGNGRPIFRQEDRSLVVAGLAVVNFVFICNDLLNDVEQIMPDIWVISPTSNPEHNKEKKEFAQKLGIQVVEVGSRYPLHTSEIIKKIKDLKDE